MVEGWACCTCLEGAAAAGGGARAEVSFGATVSVAGFLALALCAVVVAGGLAAEACRRFRQAVLDEVVLRLLQ